MSRSYKKHAFCSNTVSGDKWGEKDDKVRSNRTLRRSNKVLEKEITKDVETSEEKHFYKKHELANTKTYTFRKEGKSLVTPSCPDTSIHWTKDGKMVK